MSDLHLGPGGPPGTSGEHFFHDDAFGAFIDRLLADGTPPTLVILGDLFDLTGFDPGPVTVGPGTAERRTVRRLERVAHGHPAVFAALRRLLAAGGRLELVAGNHDREIGRPGARAWLERTLGNTDRVAVHAWIFYRPGLLYAEHGSQYHDINALVEMARPLGAEDEAERPLASFLGGGAGLLGSFTRMAALAAQAVRLSTERTKRTREAYRSEMTPLLAAEIGLPPEVLRALDGLAETTAPAIAARLLTRLVVWPAGRAVGLASPLVRPADRSAYLRRAVPHIDAALAASGCRVPFYLFGHTHFAEDVELVRGGPRYLNAGTWSEPRPASLGPSGTLTYVEIDQKAPRARLRRWDPATGAGRSANQPIHGRR